jgi:putative ABC transport system permease protein
VFLESRNLLRRPRRTLLTLVGIAIGSATYMALLAAGTGLFAEFQDAVSFLESDLLVQQASAATAWTSRVTPEDVDTLRSMAGVRRATEIVVAASRSLGQQHLIVFGLDPEDPVLARGWIVNGRPARAIGDEMLVGRRVAEAVGLNPGDRIEVRGRQFVISGVFETRRFILDGAAVMGLEAARSLFSYGADSTVVAVDVEDPHEIDHVVERISSTLPHLTASRSELWVSSYEQFVVVRRFVRGLGMLALVVTALWVSNTLSVTITERQRELAVLRALGWEKRLIATLVAGESLAVSVAGGVIGIPTAGLLVTALRHLGEAGIVSARLSPTILAEGVAVAVIAGMIGCLPPLVRALRVPALEALRAP